MRRFQGLTYLVREEAKALKLSETKELVNVFNIGIYYYRRLQQIKKEIIHNAWYVKFVGQIW